MDPHHPLDVTCVAVSQFMSVYSALAVWMVSAIQHFRGWLPSVFHDHRRLMLVPYILVLAIFVSRHEVMRYLADSSNPVTALPSHHYSVKISMYEKAELIKSYCIFPFQLLPPISFDVLLYSFVRHHLFSSPSDSLSPLCSSISASLSVS